MFVIIQLISIFLQIVLIYVLFLQLRAQAKPILEDKIKYDRDSYKLYLVLKNISLFPADDIKINIKYSKNDLKKEEVFNINYLNPNEEAYIPIEIPKKESNQEDVYLELDISIEYNKIFIFKYLIKDKYFIKVDDEIKIITKRNGICINKKLD